MAKKNILITLSELDLKALGYLAKQDGRERKKYIEQQLRGVIATNWETIPVKEQKALIKLNAKE